MMILDTNVISALIRLDADPSLIAWLNTQPRISVWTTVITVMEIRYGLAVMSTGRRRTARLAEFERVVEDDLEGRILSFDGSAAEHAAILMSERHRAGRPREIRDTMIAGIAHAQRATLATANTRHFDDLNVALVNPWQP